MVIGQRSETGRTMARVDGSSRAPSTYGSTVGEACDELSGLVSVIEHDEAVLAATAQRLKDLPTQPGNNAQTFERTHLSDSLQWHMESLQRNRFNLYHRLRVLLHRERIDRGLGSIIRRETSPTARELLIILRNIRRKGDQLTAADLQKFYANANSAQARSWLAKLGTERFGVNVVLSAPPAVHEVSTDTTATARSQRPLAVPPLQEDAQP
jgi:hypothetical protein